MKLLIAGDHIAAEFAQRVEAILGRHGVAVENIGSRSADQELPLEEMIPAVIRRLLGSDAHSAVLICGTGVGVEIGANRFSGVRAALCRDAEQAECARVYDDANVLCLGSRYDDDFEAIIQAWLSHEFDNDPGRTEMLRSFDAWGGKR